MTACGACLLHARVDADPAGSVSADALLAAWAQSATGSTPRPSLLKRSIILAKAWCYYETRILGAHHSLLSSYALEVFVLYVLLHYHHVANTPLALLCTFIEVVRSFDWQTQALSLQGAVPLNALPAACDTGARSPHCRPLDGLLISALCIQPEGACVLSELETRQLVQIGDIVQFLAVCEPCHVRQPLGDDCALARQMHQHKRRATSSCAMQARAPARQRSAIQPALRPGH